MFFRRPSEKIAMLKQVPLFSELSQKHLQQIAKHSTEVQREAETILVKQGEAGRECLVIVHGQVTVEQSGQEISKLGPGDCIGEIAVIDGEPRTATALADTAVDLLAIRPRDFLHLLDTVPGLERQILLTMCQRVRRAEKRTHF